MPRFLHTADWQIGRQYGQFPPDDAVPLAEERITVVQRIAALATERRVDAVLVAGDVFDTQTVDDRVQRRLFNALAAYRGPWLMIPGNHYAALAESVWTRARRLGCIPPDVHLLDKPGVIEMPSIGTAFLAAPLTQRHTYTDLTTDFDRWPSADGLLRVGLAHGSVQGVLADGIDATNPIHPDRARSARLDYLALGDWHGMKRIDDRTWYSGTPEPDRFRNNEAGMVLEVQIDTPGHTPVITPHAVGRFDWQSWQADIRVSSDVDALAERLAAVLPRDVVHLDLSGRADMAEHARIERLLSEAAGRARSLQVDRAAFRLMPTEADIAALQLDGYLGEVLVDLRSRQNNASVDDAEIAGAALTVLAGLLADRRAAAS
ncbi:MAG: double-strand break repair protein Mre11 [Rhizobacter sp.]|nr:double-strand break repair protein Mre11 [Rhizobacter sp.]